MLQGIERIVNNTRSNSNFLGVNISDNIIGEFNPLEHDLNDWLQSIDEYSQING